VLSLEIQQHVLDGKHGRRLLPSLSSLLLGSQPHLKRR